MTYKAVADGAMKLAPDERLRLVALLNESFTADASTADLTAAQSADLGRRAAEHERNPIAGVPWDAVVRDILSRRGDLHLISRVPGTGTADGE